jgi:hypothetical protein
MVCHIGQISQPCILIFYVELILLATYFKRIYQMVSRIAETLALTSTSHLAALAIPFANLTNASLLPRKFMNTIKQGLEGTRIKRWLKGVHVLSDIVER